jgi:hypothetical protein
MRHFASLSPLRIVGMTLLSSILIVIASAPSPAHAADFYRVSLTRIDQDLYRDGTSRVLIKTRYCYEYVYGDDAVLVWDGPYSWSNKIVFSSGSSCEVAGAYKG